MKGRLLSISGLICCWSFFICNIIYDRLNHPTENFPEDTGLANGLWYFIPLFCLMNTLMWAAYENFKSLGKAHKVQWFCFFLFSVQQTIRNSFFDPFITTPADWLIAASILVYLFYHLMLKRSE